MCVNEAIERSLKLRCLTPGKLKFKKQPTVIVLCRTVYRLEKSKVILYQHRLLISKTRWRCVQLAACRDDWIGWQRTQDNNGRSAPAPRHRRGYRAQASRYQLIIVEERKILIVLLTTTQ